MSRKAVPDILGFEDFLKDWQRTGPDFSTKEISGSRKKLPRYPVGVHAKLRAASRRPQAIFKIISKGRGARSAYRMLEYVSRKGDLPLEDLFESQVRGLDAIHNLVDDWSADFSTRANAVDVVHMMVSSPRDSLPGDVAEAARDFLQHQFPGHSYAMVLHRDTDYPHVHAIVVNRCDDGRRLQIRKKDLVECRQAWAQALLRRGIQLDASYRFERGVARKGMRQSVRFALEKGLNVRSIPFGLEQRKSQIKRWVKEIQSISRAIESPEVVGTWREQLLRAHIKRMNQQLGATHGFVFEKGRLYKLTKTPRVRDGSRGPGLGL